MIHALVSLLSIHLISFQHESLFTRGGEIGPGWALRKNGSCKDPSSPSACGKTVDPFWACCPSSSLICLRQYNSACCPSGSNCTASLGLRCADSTWTLCDNNGYFCCPPRFSCFKNIEFGSDGCAEPGYQFQDAEVPLPKILEGDEGLESAITEIFSNSVKSKAASLTTITTTSPDVPTFALSKSYTSSSTFNPSMLSTTGDSATSTIPSASYPSLPDSGNGVSTNDVIAIVIGVGTGIATIVGAFFTWKAYMSNRSKPH